jgi:GcrA cell cycle regulator
MTWTPELIGELTKLWGEGLSTAEIGKRLGVSKNAVVGKAHRLHLSTRPSPIRRMSMRPAMPRMARPRLAPMLSGVSAAPPPPPEPRKVVELSNQICRWPIGHPGDKGFHFCTDRAIVGKPYCEHHSAMAYVKVKAKAG